jgi:hypothetical protein
MSKFDLIGCEDGDIPCDRCAGTGNLIKDWDRYVSAKTTEEIEACESDCPDCSGYGRFRADPAPPSQDVAGWQLLETAPKDRTRILLWSANWLHPTIGYWSDAYGVFIEHGTKDQKANAATHWAPLQPPATQPAPAEQSLGIELQGVAEQLADNAGFWHSCSGCHNLNEGHPTGEYSAILKCHLGMGCSECGGVGAVWDNTDYSDYGNEQPSEHVRGSETAKAIALGASVLARIEDPAVREIAIRNALTMASTTHTLGDDDTETLHSEATPEGGVIRLAKWPEGYVLWHHGEIAWRSWMNKSQQISVTLSADTKPVQDAIAAAQNVVATPADQIIGQIEELFPNWRSYRDIVDCITCELHELRKRAEGGR